MNPAIATVIGAVMGGAVAIIVAVINSTVGRGGRRADIADKVSQAWDPVFDRMDKDLERVSKQCEKCENRLAVTQRALAEMETEFRRTKSTLRALIRVLDENDPAQIAVAIAAARDMT